MYPWEQYPPEDPRSYPMNYQTDGNGNLVYIGPANGVPVDASGTVQGAAPAYDYAAAEPYGTSHKAIHAGSDSNTLRSQEAYGPPMQSGYNAPQTQAMPSDGSGTLYVPEWQPGTPTLDWLAPVGAALDAATAPAPAPLVSHAENVPGPYASYDPLSSANPGNPAPAATDGYNYGAAEPYAGNEPVPGSYEDYLKSAATGAFSPTLGGAAPAALPPGTTATAPGLAPAVGDPGNPYGAAPAYGGGGGYAADGAGGGFGFGSQYPYPSTPGGPMPSAGPPNPRGFDPFLHSGVGNPLPPPSPMRQQIMQAGGFAGPAWYPGPPPAAPGQATPASPPQPLPVPVGPSPAELRGNYEEAMRIGAQIAQTNAAPAPFSGMQYVASKLKLNPTGY